MLQVAWQPPVPGETLRYEVSTAYALTSPKATMKGQSHFLTDEVVKSVDHDAIDELEVTFVEGKYQPDLAVPLVETKGTFRVHGGYDRKSVFSLADGSTPSDEVAKALRGYARGDVGQPHWLLRLLTDRTFEVGRETVLPHQSVDGPEGHKVDVRITLQSISTDRAAFVAERHVWRGNRRLAIVRSKIVLDTAHARFVSVDEAEDPDVSPELLQKAGASMHIESHEVFRYAFPSSSVARSTPDACNQPRTLEIDKVEPRVGDIYSADQEVKLDETLENEKSEHSVRIRGGWTSSTDQRVTEVQDGLVTGIEVQVRKERILEAAPDTAAKPDLVHDGEVIAIHPSGAQSVVTRDGTEVNPRDDRPLEVALAAMMTKEWTTRVATQRTYQLGIEQYFSSEIIRPLSSKPSPVRATLSSIDGDVATFKLDIKTVLDAGAKPRPVFFRGTLSFDVKNARPIALHLDGDIELRDGVTKQGEYVTDFRFRY